MARVSIRDLHNHGREVAELRPLRPPLSAAALLDRWSRLRALDPASLRRDVDRLLDPAVSVRVPIPE